MKFGRVIGSLVNSVADEGLEAVPLKLVQLLTEEGVSYGDPVIAGDRIGVGPGEFVFMEEAREAGLGMEEFYCSLDLGIVGRADQWMVRGRLQYG
jgi:microcompartment protein CcmK/EutM